MIGLPWKYNVPEPDLKAQVAITNQIVEGILFEEKLKNPMLTEVLNTQYAVTTEACIRSNERTLSGVRPSN